MTEQVAKKRGRPAKRKLTDITFDHDGAHLALVSKDLNAGPANGQDYMIFAKSIEGFSDEIIEKASQVTVTLPIEEFLRKFFGLWTEDAEVLARAMGYTTEAMDYAEKEKLEEEAVAAAGIVEEDNEYSYEGYIQKRLASFSIMKSMHESDTTAMANLTGEQYLQLLQDQEQLEKTFTKVNEIKQSAKVMVKKESDLKATTSGSDTQHDANASIKNSRVENKVEPSGSVQKTKEGNYMTKEVKTVVADVEKELVEKSVLVDLQKAMETQAEELTKALALVKQFEQEKKDAITKSRMDKLSAIVKNQEQVDALFKGANLLEDAEFGAFLKAVADIQAIADQSELFKAVGADGQVEQKADEGLSDVKKAFRKIQAKVK
jgi:hypothetical protein